MAMALNLGTPSKENFSELNLWKKVNTKTTVNVAPSAQSEIVTSLKTAEYKVKNGDTLGAIAYKYYGISTPEKIQKIQLANKMKTPDNLQLDQKLIIPMED